MRITKLSHATLIVEDGGQSLLIDPGTFTEALPDLPNLSAVVITHEHPDHWKAEHLDTVVSAHPKVPIYGPEGVARAAAGYDITVVEPGETVEAGGFTLSFFGGEHAVIHKTIPVVDNVGVLVNERFYYPGDSYAVPKKVNVEVLAAPLGAPWLKIGDAMDFVVEVSPRHAFGTHDATLSTAGITMHRQRLQWATEENGGTFYAIDPGDAIEV